MPNTLDELKEQAAKLSESERAELALSLSSNRWMVHPMRMLMRRGARKSNGGCNKSRMERFSLFLAMRCLHACVVGSGWAVVAKVRTERLSECGRRGTRHCRPRRSNRLV